MIALSIDGSMFANVNDSVLVFESVSKSYDGIQALDSVSFKIPKGAIFGYIGPNGAGKTTTIKIIVGLIQNHEGAVLIDGQRISELRANVYRTLGQPLVVYLDSQNRGLKHVSKMY